MNLTESRLERRTVRSTEMQKIKAFLREKDVLVSSTEDVEELSSRGYGVTEDGGLVLTFFEALFLLSKGVIEIADEMTDKEVSFQHLLMRYQSVDENAWAKYLIYRDLRSRGYVTREGFGWGIEFRVYERGKYGTATATYLVFGIQEGQPVSVEELIGAMKHVQGLKKRLVLAVLNRRGEVVYYSLSQLTMK